jgi:hypothetical protein
MAIRSDRKRRATNANTCRDAPIQPLGIIDQAHERPLLGRRRQQAQHGKSHHEVIRGSAIL